MFQQAQQAPHELNKLVILQLISYLLCAQLM